MEEYLRHSFAFQKRLALLGPNRKREAQFLFFRMVGPSMQKRLEKYVNLSQVPRVFLHGNPHLDNYVRTFRGSALLDFDRSRIGPYCWDIIRFLSSVSLRRDEDSGFLDKDVVEYFIDGYFTHFMNPDIPFKQIKILKAVEPLRWQLNTKEYLKGNHKWAKKMRQFPIPKSNREVMDLLRGYLTSINEGHLLNDYEVSEVGCTPGTLGKKHFIYSLVPKNSDAFSDSILLDIKEVYEEKDTKFFYSPWDHHGKRMNEASKLYAEGMEKRLGHSTLGGKQYWGREIPSFAVKVKRFLDVDDQKDVIYSIGSQLGKGHRKSLVDAKLAEMLAQDFLHNFDHYYKVSKYLTYELKLAFDFITSRDRLQRAYLEW